MAFEKRDATLFISLHEHKHPAINDMHFDCVCTRLAKKESLQRKSFAIFMPILLQNKL